MVYSPAGTIVAPLDGPVLSGAATAGGNGGFLSNLDNNYVSATINRGYGQVLVSRMRVASFANTRGGETPMPGAQLRYWSMCENDPFTERFVACGTDDQSTQRPSGYATYVVSTPAQRPRNATAACGVNWLPWGPDQAGLLILRNMLPDPAFKQSVQDATVGKEAQTMGSYLPASRYYSKAGFEALGCGGAAAAVPVAGSGARCPRATGRLRGAHLGLLRLGLKRAQARRDYAYSTRGKRYKDFFCLTPQGIRVGYASPRLLRSLGARERARFRGRVVVDLDVEPALLAARCASGHGAARRGAAAAPRRGNPHRAELVVLRPERRLDRRPEGSSRCGAGGRDRGQVADAGTQRPVQIHDQLRGLGGLALPLRARCTGGAAHGLLDDHRPGEREFPEKTTKEWISH